MENIIVAVSNIPALLSISLSLEHNDYITAFSILFVFIGSVVSHLLENHKHGMPGILNVSPTTCYLWCKVDVSGCLIVGSRFIYLLYSKNCIDIFYNNQYMIYWLITALSFNLISEYDKYNSNRKYIYIPCHIMWHINIFMLMYKGLNIIYTNY